MRHGVLGGGGIGGLLAGALARSGVQVTLLLRPDSLPRYGGRLRVESVVLGDFEVDVPAVSRLKDPVDVLWVTTKATQLEAALSLAAPDVLGDAFVVPLLNGVDHMDLLRSRYPNVVAAAIRVESERVSPGLIRQRSPFLRLDIAGAVAVQAAVRDAGIECRSGADERSVLWEKLALLAPIALATTAFAAPLGSVRGDPSFLGCRDEAFAAAGAAGAAIDPESIRRLHEAAPAEMQSSMQKDVASRREPEVNAIAEPIIRSGRQHGFSTTFTRGLVDRIKARLR
jgi:2-dehydropantoate 2-reductase